MQESGPIEIIPMIYTLTIWGQYPIFLHPESTQGPPSGRRRWLVASWSQHPLFTEMAGNILCPQCTFPFLDLYYEIQCTLMNFYKINTLVTTMQVKNSSSPAPPNAHLRPSPGDPLLLHRNHFLLLLYHFITQGLSLVVVIWSSAFQNPWCDF